MKLSELRNPEPFSIETAAFGPLKFRWLSFGELESLVAIRAAADPKALVDRLISLIARDEAGAPLALEKVGELTPAEREEFARGFIEAQPHMFRATPAEGNERPETTPLEEGETAEAYVARGLARYIDQHRQALDASRLRIESLTGWANQDTLAALSANSAISQGLAASGQQFKDYLSHHDLAVSGLGASIAKNMEGLGSRADVLRRLADTADPVRKGYLSPETALPKPAFIPPLPPIPGHLTNDLLEELVEKFETFEARADQAIELVRTMNDAAAGLLTTFAEGAKAAERAAEKTEAFARGSTWLARIAIVIAILTPIAQTAYDVWKSSRQDEDTNRVVSRVLDGVAASQKQSTADFERVVTSVVEKTGAQQQQVQTVLRTLIETLVRQQKGVADLPRPSPAQAAGSGH